jgi:hypothetical protein
MMENAQLHRSLEQMNDISNLLIASEMQKAGLDLNIFEVCTWVGKTKERQTWQDIAALEHDRMNIESHTMTHAHLPTLLSSPS